MVGCGSASHAGVRVLIPPLRRIRWCAAHLLSERALERTIDPLLSDIQNEYTEWIHAGRSVRAKWTLLAGHFIFLKVAAICLSSRVGEEWRGWTVQDSAVARRTLTGSFLALVVVAALSEWIAVRRLIYSDNFRPIQLAYLLPSQLMLAMPAGLAFGVMWGFHGRAPSRRTHAATMLLACALCVTAATCSFWLVPEGNRAFSQLRLEMLVERGYSQSLPVPLESQNGGTLGDLAARINQLKDQGSVMQLPRVQFQFNLRIALVFAPLAVGLALLAQHRRVRTLFQAMCMAFGVCFLYWFAVRAGQTLASGRYVSPLLAAWLANLTLFACAIVRHRGWKLDSREEI
jgi:hypothetical protein